MDHQQRENEYSETALAQQYQFNVFNENMADGSRNQHFQVNHNSNYQLMTTASNEYCDPDTTSGWYYNTPSEANLDDFNQTERGIAGFVSKLYQCLEAPDDGNKYARWCKHNGVDMFMIDCIPKFTEIVLPHLFKHCKFASFVRQLNIYGFQRDTDARKTKGNREKHTCRWHHVHFRPGRRDLFHLIRRKSPRYSRKRKQSLTSEAGEGDDDDPETVLHLISGDDLSDTTVPHQEEEEQEAETKLLEQEDDEVERSTGSLGRSMKEMSPPAAPVFSNGMNSKLQYENSLSVLPHNNVAIADHTSSPLQEQQMSMRPDNSNSMCHSKSALMPESETALQQGTAYPPSVVYSTSVTVPTGFSMSASQTHFEPSVARQSALLSQEVISYNKIEEMMNMNNEFNSPNQRTQSMAMQTEEERCRIQILQLKRDYIQMYNILSGEVNKSLHIIEAQRSRIESLEGALYRKQQQQQFSFNTTDDVSTSMTSTPTLYSHQADAYMPLPPSQEMNNNRSILHPHQNDVVISTLTPTTSLYPTPVAQHNQPLSECLLNEGAPFNGYENDTHPPSVPFTTTTTIDPNHHQWLPNFSSH